MLTFIGLEIPTVQGKRTFCQTFFNYKIDQEARTKVIEVTPEDPNQVHVYTDGSKDETGRTGYGYTIKTRDRTLQGEKHFNLGTMPTVFQAEVMAIHAAADWLHEKGTYGKIIDFYIDNQAAIFALKNLSCMTDWLWKLNANLIFFVKIIQSNSTGYQLTVGIEVTKLLTARPS